MSNFFRALEAMRGPGWSLFDRMMQQMASAEAEMEAMSRNMFRYFPREHNWRNIGKEMEGKALGEMKTVDEGGQTKLKVEVDISKFKPEDVEVKIVENNILQITAHQEEQVTDGFQRFQLFRQFTLPEGVDAGTIKPSISKEGTLKIEALAPKLNKSQERRIPIEFWNKTMEGEKN